MTNIDKFELYTFCFELYTLLFFYLFISDLSFIKLFIINILGNFGFHYIFNFNIIKFLRHHYWTSHLNDIALPQLISCASNILINNYCTDYQYIIIPSNIALNYFIITIYKDEISESRNLRILITIPGLLYYLFF